MDIEPITVKLTCLFCDSVLTGNSEVKLNSGDLIQCAACGNGNDYDSVLEIAKQKGISEMTEIAKNKVAEEFKKIFRK